VCTIYRWLAYADDLSNVATVSLISVTKQARQKSTAGEVIAVFGF
jgi:hypothetical protein